MAKELILYSTFNRYSAESAVNQLNLIDDNEELTVRINTPGGEVISGWSIISRLSERTANTTAIVDGQAASMGAIMLLYFDKVVANDTSIIMFHKAAYPEWYTPNESEKAQLENINKQFEAKIKKKVEGKPGSDEFLAKVFQKDARNDVELTMKEAKKLGIVTEIRTLEPKAYSGMQMVAMYDGDKMLNKHPESGAINQLKNESMDLTKLKSEHPALYSQVLAEGEKEGIRKERDRVGSWLAFVSHDVEAVTKGIKDGESLTQTSIAEFSAKAISKLRVEDHKEDNAGATSTDKSGKTEEQIKAETQEKEAIEALAKLGIK